MDFNDFQNIYVSLPFPKSTLNDKTIAQWVHNRHRVTLNAIRPDIIVFISTVISAVSHCGYISSVGTPGHTQNKEGRPEGV